MRLVIDTGDAQGETKQQMSTAANAHPITVEQYEHFKGYPGLRDELVYGEIVLSPHAKPFHLEIARMIDDTLRRVLEGTAYTTVRESNVKFPALNSMPGPDVYVVTRQALLESFTRDEYISEPPVLVVEVLSPANRKKRVAQKTEIYLSSGVVAVWTVDPKAQTVTVNAVNFEQVFQMGDYFDLPAKLSAANISVAELLTINV